MHTVTHAPERDKQWFAAFYKDTHPHVHAYLYRRAPEATQDLTSEVYLTAWKRRLDIPDHRIPWLYNVAANHLQHHTRSKARRARLDAKIAFHNRDTSHRPTDHATDRLAAIEEVHKLLKALGEADAEILTLWAWENLSTADIATALGISGMAARARLSRARKRAAKIAKRSGGADIIQLFSA